MDDQNAKTRNGELRSIPLVGLTVMRTAPPVPVEVRFTCSVPISAGYFEEGAYYTIEHASVDAKRRWRNVRPSFDHASGYVTIDVPLADGEVIG